MLPGAVFPQGDLANSPTEPIAIPAKMFGDFAGQTLIGEMNAARLVRFLGETVDGTLQGALLPFLDTKARRRSIASRVGQAVAACRRPAVLGFAVGAEIPAPIVRWYGRERIERFILRLYEEAKSTNPNALVTYVNYPTTEYLDLSFLDFHSWNVYLETPQQLTRYLARLQNLAGEKPLVLAELGLDSQRNGERKQAELLDWQIAPASWGSPGPTSGSAPAARSSTGASA